MGRGAQGALSTAGAHVALVHRPLHYSTNARAAWAGRRRPSQPSAFEGVAWLLAEAGASGAGRGGARPQMPPLQVAGRSMPLASAAFRMYMSCNQRVNKMGIHIFRVFIIFFALQALAQPRSWARLRHFHINAVPAGAHERDGVLHLALPFILFGPVPYFIPAQVVVLRRAAAQHTAAAAARSPPPRPWRDARR